MSAVQYIRLAREKWLTILGAAAAGLLLGVAVSFLVPPTYTARATLYVSSQSVENPTSLYQGALLSQERVKSYTELASSSRVASDVIAQRGLPDTPEEFIGRVSASSAPDSVLIDVDVRASTPDGASGDANAVAQDLVTLVDEIERPSDPRVQSPISVRVVQPAVAPTERSSTGPGSFAAVGLFSGLIIGTGAVLARSALDTSVRSVDQLRELVGVAHLASIPFDNREPEVCILGEGQYSRRAEAYRSLRTNLQYIDVDNPRRVIASTSATPGEGKTVTTINLAVALAAAGHTVVIVDADLRRPRLGDLLGIDSTVGLTTTLSTRIELREAVQHTRFARLDLLPSGQLPPNPSELLSSQQMKRLLVELRNRYDFVLVDTPPVIPVTDAASIAQSVDGVLLVSRYRALSRTQLSAAVDSLNVVSAKLVGTVLNAVPLDDRDSPGYSSYYDPRQAASQPVVVEPTPARSESAVDDDVRTDAYSRMERPVPHRRAKP